MRIKDDLVIWIFEKCDVDFSKNPRQQCPKNKNLDPEHIRTPKIIEIGLETMENDHFEDGCILIQIFFKNLDFSDRQNVDLLKEFWRQILKFQMDLSPSSVNRF